VLVFMQKILIIDTSILCVYLEIPGKETCGSQNDNWTKDRVDQKIIEEEKIGTTFVLPLATIIETGNHIAQIKKGDRYTPAQKLVGLIEKVADETTPWASFTRQQDLWDSHQLKRLAYQWLKGVTQGLSMGDVSISSVADDYAKYPFQVEILTGDEGLKSLEPSPQLSQPRRRK